MALKLDRRYMERLILGNWDVQRFTQDSPVLPDVWIAYGVEPNKPLDLILTLERSTDAGQVARSLRGRCSQVRDQEEEANREFKPRLAYTQGHVACRLTLEQTVRLVLPLTHWWRDLLQDLDAWSWKEIEAVLGHGLPAVAQTGVARQPSGADSRVQQQVWVVRLLGTLKCCQDSVPAGDQTEEPKTGDGHSEEGNQPEDKTPKEEEEQFLSPEETFFEPGDIAQAFRRLRDAALPCDGPAKIHLISRNRPSGLAVDRSCLAVKADAARRLFDVSCRKICWGIIDSGIDAAHPVFCDPEATTDAQRLKTTRIKATYDFTRVRDLLDPDVLESSKPPDFLKALLTQGDPGQQKRMLGQLKELKQRLLFGRPVDWSLLDELLRVPHRPGEYEPPESEHGTHVAGILGASGDIEGVCPDIQLYDLRVVKPGADNDEFSVLAALQFVQHLNDRKDFFAIHGVNVSLSIAHAVENYACGRTPVCNECANLVNSGVVVVAAAGNQGYLRYQTEEGNSVSGYRTVSITDPGNAANVITVGATHRSNPHSYGVSFFSSRGPTGDGRCKPDLVAPGEKINAPIPGGGKACKDGTSMAAPHVSGAAAMLMARHREFVGRPAEIKDILCRTATDLGRERYFQGAGMLDVLRALQSI